MPNLNLVGRTYVKFFYDRLYKANLHFFTMVIHSYADEQFSLNINVLKRTLRI